MKTEFEATFKNIDKDQLRSKLKELSAQLITSEQLLRRVNFDFPAGHESNHAYVRVRDEGDKITMTSKHFLSYDKIEDQKEAEVVIDNFDQAVAILKMIGCQPKAVQESKRELWQLGDVEIMIDTWPFLEPFVEIEGKNEQDVQAVAGQLGFDYGDAIFDSVAVLYQDKYGMHKDDVNNNTPEILFDMDNPFV